jgi:opacity protein-like surface antigen
MNKTASYSMLALALVSSSAIAGSMSTREEHTFSGISSWFSPFIATLSVGPTWESSGENQTIYLTPDIVKTYAGNNSSHALADGEFFVGTQKFINENFMGQLGLAIAGTTTAKVSGEIWDDADPIFNNYSYNYDVQHTHIALKGKLLMDRDYFVIPWLSASIGVGFNYASAFDNTPLIFEAITNPNFSSHMQTAFTYTIGAGVQRALSEHWQVGIGYEFADWGKSQLGRAPDQTTGTGPVLNHLYTNGVLLNITWVS